MKWRLTWFRGIEGGLDTPSLDDGCLVDDAGATLARVYRFEHGPQKGRWYWTVMVDREGRPRNAGSGFEDTREAAKAACEARFSTA